MEKLKNLKEYIKNDLPNAGKKLKGKVLPLTAAALLSLQTLFALPTATNKDISANYKTPNYKTELANFSGKSMETINNKILSSKLMTTANYLDAEKEIINLLTASNYNLLELSLLYKSLKVSNLQKTNLSEEVINNALAKNFVGIDEKTGAEILKVVAPEVISTALDTLILIRYGADKAKIDNGNGFYRNLEIKRFGKRDLIKEATATLDLVVTDLTNIMEYLGSSSVKFNQDLTAIKTSVAKNNFNKNDDKLHDTLIESTSQALSKHASQFGDKKLCKALLTEISSQYALNHMLVKFEKASNVEIGTFITQKQIGAQLNIATQDKPINLGGELVVGKYFNDKGYAQILGTAEVGNNKLSATAKTGVQLNSNGANLVLGAEGKYTWQINDQFSILGNVAGAYQSKKNISGRAGVTLAYRNANGTLLKFFVGLEAGKSLNNTGTIGKLPTPGNPPIYGEDDVQKDPETPKEYPDVMGNDGQKPSSQYPDVIDLGK